MLRCQSKRLTLLNQITLFSSFVVIKPSKMVDIQSSFRPVILFQLLYLINLFHSSSFCPLICFTFQKLIPEVTRQKRAGNKDRQQKQNPNSVIFPRSHTLFTSQLSLWPQQIPWITGWRQIPFFTIAESQILAPQLLLDSVFVFIFGFIPPHHTLLRLLSH